MNKKLTQDRLKQVFHYNQETGIFTRKLAPCNRVKPGDVVTRTNDKGYYVLRVDGHLYLAHRLAWLYVNGFMPEKFVDHINGVRTDNRISNLREASQSENQQNRNKPRIDNKRSSHIGVGFLNGKWRARIQINGQSHHLGTFLKEQEAIKAYITAKTKLHPYSTLRSTS